MPGLPSIRILACMRFPKKIPETNHRRFISRAVFVSMAPALVIALSLYLIADQGPVSGTLRGVLVGSELVTDDRVRDWTNDGINAIVLSLSEDAAARNVKAAARRIQSAGLALYYWIEVGRNPAMAEAHPEWMASLQGHPEWRRHFPGLRESAKDEVVKNYPWVPVGYAEPFDAHLERVAALVKGQPLPVGVFLNDLQSAPSACGCGNSLCRWTPGYGPIHTATRLSADAAEKFASAVQQLMPRARIIPVWTTECEELDGVKNGPCAGVGCFSGACWKEFTAQLMPVAAKFDSLAVLLLYRVFDRDLTRYGAPAGWVKDALDSFRSMPPRRHGKAIAANRLIAILQGWDVSPAQREAQILRSQEAGAAGYVLALAEIDQSWEPRITKTERKR
jgi:hypothetical protein